MGRGRKPVGRRIQGPGGGAQVNDTPPSPQEFSLEGLREEQLMWEGKGVLLAGGTQKRVFPLLQSSQGSYMIPRSQVLSVTFKDMH